MSESVDQDGQIRALYGAFAAAPKPARDVITPHRCGECDEVASRLAPHEARSVPDEDTFWLGDSLPLLGPEAFRYYLPRFIEFSVTQPHSSLATLILYSFVPSPTLDIGSQDRFALFTHDERQAILAYLRHRVGLPDAEFERDDIDAAMAYWAGTDRASAAE
jgi:hypothetical protein